LIVDGIARVENYYAAPDLAMSVGIYTEQGSSYLADGVSLQSVSSNDSKIVPSTSQDVEEINIACIRRCDDGSIGQNNFGCNDIVCCPSILGAEIT
jgi:hypothetical protein